ncbi:hypothetical protein [Bacillus thermotolerans]|uniref:Phenylalanyl-tRNA synthetase subunit beta n=1 Tax=Bacillus thermotolerans TaxID=1221996 RepID=A0A0F5I721_BACTR|nr:hypothetical protein [Bacillus thermotolerans]KKB41243.1 hypothetical protein QY95_00950 [Bacillus thermotolerans]KKB44105.1 hypothetical protein QY96_03731 [Bacillus thermotolerans]
MRLIKVLLGIVGFVVLLGIAGLYFGTQFVSDKVMEEVSAQLENSGELDKLKEQVKNDPQLQAFIAEGANVNSESLPFQTKEEAVRELATKFNVSELKEIQSDLQSGNKQEILNKLEGKLTEEEVLALKMLAYKELNQ